MTNKLGVSELDGYKSFIKTVDEFYNGDYPMNSFYIYEDHVCMCKKFDTNGFTGTYECFVVNNQKIVSSVDYDDADDMINDIHQLYFNGLPWLEIEDFDNKYMVEDLLNKINK